MESSYPLTPLQQGMLLEAIDPDSRDCYVIQTVFAWSERISPIEFERAWQILASRHEALRSSFRWKDTPQPRQVVAANAAVDFSLVSIADNSQAQLEAFLDMDRKRGFAVADAPPWRVIALRAPPGGITAVWTFHHLLLDGRSHILLLRELLAIYDGLLTGTMVETRPEVGQQEYSRWMEKQDFGYAKDYWSHYLNSMSMPACFPAPSGRARPSRSHASYTGTFGPELTGQLYRFSKTAGISVGNVIQASSALVLGWLANETDVVIGAVRACRKSALPNADNLIGIMINTVPLRVGWNGDAAVGSVLQGVSRDWHDIRNYEQTPLREIRRWVDLSANTELFGMVVSFSSPHLMDAVFDDAESRSRRRIWLRQTTPYCSAEISASAAEVVVGISVPDALVEPDIARQLPDFLRNTVSALVAGGDPKVRNISPLAAAERKRLIAVTNSRWEAKAERIEWLDRISHFAAANPAGVAVESGPERVSWQDLERKSSQLAALLDERGLHAGDLVAVFLPRSPEFVWTCLGILKAGGAYLPLDIEWPPLRVKTVLDDSKVFSTITDGGFQHLLLKVGAASWIPDLSLQAPLAARIERREIGPDALAYVIYTSGSSGTPKGVEITHGGLQNLIDDAIATFSLGPDDRGSWVSNLAFDASVHEMWPVLAAGAGLFLPASTILQNPSALLNWMGERQISIAFVSVIMAEAMLQIAGGRPLALRYLLTGGDQLRRRPGPEIAFQLINEYGPTEYSVVATRYPVVHAAAADETIPIGKPLRGTRAYVMNSSQQLLPEGAPGELVLAGNGQARGYRHQPALTNEKFILNNLPEEPCETLYRSGDLVRWTKDGNLQFLGRLDSQIKLRGFRIELGEIEACLLAHPLVAEAVVLLRHDPEPRLVAFTVLSHEPLPHKTLNGEARNIDPAPSLMAHLRQLMPDYMVPSRFLFLRMLPTNSSGKYDRKQLAAMALPGDGQLERKPLAFASMLEEQVAAIWKEILSVPDVHPEDRFLSLGGTSVSIINLLCAVNLNFGAEIPVAEVFSNPTPGELAALIQSSEERIPRPLVRLRGSGLERPLFCIPGAGGGIHWFRDLVAAVDADRTIFGVELLALSETTQAHFAVGLAAVEIADLITASVGDLACSLCGYSGGGLLALAVAQTLQSRGKGVDHVFLLDTYPPPTSNGNFAKARRWLRGWWSLPRGQRWEALMSRLNWLGQRPSRQPVSEIERSLQAIKQRHIQAFVQHRMEPYAGPASLFFSQDRPISVRAAIHHDWNHYLTGPVSFTILRGDHYSLLRRENAKQLAHYLSAVPGAAAAAASAEDSGGGEVVTAGKTILRAP